MKKTVASIQVDSVEQLADILKSFNPGSADLRVRVEDADIDVMSIELNSDESGYHFVFVPKIVSNTMKAKKPI